MSDIIDLDSNDVYTTKNLDKVSWSNTSREIISAYKCIVPRKILRILQSAAVSVPSSEFSFLFKSKIDNEQKCVIIDADDWFYPKQTVSSTSVEYEEDNTEYNTVIHKHPNGATAFSETDKKYINSNFKVSLLWVNNKFSTGIINVQSELGLVQIPLNILIENEFNNDEEIVELVKNKTTIKTYTTTVYGCGNYLNNIGTQKSTSKNKVVPAVINNTPKPYNTRDDFEYSDEELANMFSSDWWK